MLELINSARHFLVLFLSFGIKGFVVLMIFKGCIGACLVAISIGCLADVVPASVNETAYLGMAYHSEAKEFINIRCIDVENVKRTRNFDALNQGEILTDLTYSQLKDVFSDNSGLGAQFPSVRLEGETKFIEKAATDDLSASFVFHHEARVLATTVDIPVGDPAYISEACQFDRVYPQLNGVDVSLEQIPVYIGDSWLRAIEWGGSVDVALKITYSSKSLRDYFSGRISMADEQSIVIHGELTEEEIEKTSNSKIEVVAFQKGGDPSALLKSIPDNLMSCKFTDIDNCINLFNEIVSYAALDFSRQMTNASREEDFSFSGAWSVLAPIRYIVDSYQNTFSSLSVDDNWEVNDKNLLRSNIRDLDYRFGRTIRDLNYLERELNNRNWRQEYKESLAPVYGELKKYKNNLLQAQNYCLSILSGAKCAAFLQGAGINNEIDTSNLYASTPIIRQFKVINNREIPSITWDVVGAQSCHVTWFDAEGNKESHYGLARTVNIRWHQTNYDYRDTYTAEINCIAEAGDSTLREQLTFSTRTAKLGLNLGDRGHRIHNESPLVLPTVISTTCSHYCGGRGDSVSFDIEWHAPTASYCELRRTSTYNVPGYRGAKGHWHTEKLVENLSISGEYTFNGNESSFSRERYHENNKFIFSCFDDDNAPIYSTSFFVTI